MGAQGPGSPPETVELSLTLRTPGLQYTCVLSRFSYVWLFETLWTVAHLAPLSIEFSRQEYWGGLPCPPSGDLTDPGIEPTSLMSTALAGVSLPLAPSGKPIIFQLMCYWIHTTFLGQTSSKSESQNLWQGKQTFVKSQTWTTEQSRCCYSI